MELLWLHPMGGTAARAHFITASPMIRTSQVPVPNLSEQDEKWRSMVESRTKICYPEVGQSYVCCLVSTSKVQGMLNMLTIGHTCRKLLPSSKHNDRMWDPDRAQRRVDHDLYVGSQPSQHIWKS